MAPEPSWLFRMDAEMLGALPGNLRLHLNVGLGLLLVRFGQDGLQIRFIVASPVAEGYPMIHVPLVAGPDLAPRQSADAVVVGKYA